MKMFNYLAALLPNLNKEEILEDLRMTGDELNLGVIPAWEEASKFFDKNKIQSDEVKALSKVFYSTWTGRSKRPNMVLDITDNLEKLKVNLAYVNREIELMLEKEVIRDGLTAKKTVLIRAADQISFLSRFLTDLLNYIYCFETAQRASIVADSFKVSKVQIRAIEHTFSSFARLFGIYGQDAKVFMTKYDSVPDVLVNIKNYSAVSATFQENKLDPFGTELVAGFESNPIYHFRLMITEWQSDRYKSFKEKKRALELKLLNLEASKTGEHNPKLEQEIEYVQARVEKLEYKIAKVEESVK